MVSSWPASYYATVETWIQTALWSNPTMLVSCLTLTGSWLAYFYAVVSTALTGSSLLWIISPIKYLHFFFRIFLECRKCIFNKFWREATTPLEPHSALSCSRNLFGFITLLIERVSARTQFIDFKNKFLAAQTNSVLMWLFQRQDLKRSW